MLAYLFSALPGAHPPLPNDPDVERAIDGLLTFAADQRKRNPRRLSDFLIAWSDIHQTVISLWSGEQRGRLIDYLLRTEGEFVRSYYRVGSVGKENTVTDALPPVARNGLDDFRDVYAQWPALLLRRRLILSPAGAAALAEALVAGSAPREDAAATWVRLDGRPIGSYLRWAIESFGGHAVPPALRRALENLRGEIAAVEDFLTASKRRKFMAQIDHLLREHTDRRASAAAVELQFEFDEPVSVMVVETLSTLPSTAQGPWVAFVRHGLTAAGLKVTDKFAAQSRLLTAAIGAEGVRRVTDQWIDFLLTMPRTQREEVTAYDEADLNMYNGFLTPQTLNLMRGVVHARGQLGAPADVDALDRLATWAEHTVRGAGPRAKPLAHAAYQALAAVPEGGGLPALTRQRARVERPAILKILDRIIAGAAAAAGMDLGTLADTSTPDYGLTEGTLEQAFGGYTAALTLEAPGKTGLVWRTSAGKTQRGVPSAVKADSYVALQLLQQTRKALHAESSAQRNRVEDFYRDRREWRFAAFAKTIHGHGLLGWFSRRLIWAVTEPDATSRALRYYDEAWRTCDGRAHAPSPDATVRLWHPAEATADEVADWRAHCYAKELVQPFKQAFREVYLPTPAERETNTYSNRFAAHILRQSQLRALCRTRSWQTSLMAAFDGGSETTATLQLPAFGLEARLYLDAVSEETDYTGSYAYVGTDRVEFRTAGARWDAGRVALTQVPAVAFSEVMRDCDLFVGVTSVANDPQWIDRDQRPQEQILYWRNTSFGDIGMGGELRHEVLAKLLPRLKIRDVAELTDKFLVVRGTRHTYKIHLGSGNVLVAPNDRYLCIVAARPARTPKLYIPFDGDERLSLILSKAFLLAADDKIEDEMILRQL